MPVTAPEQPALSLFRTLREAQVDPDLTHEASEKICAQAGRNVTAVVEPRCVEVKVEIRSLSSRIDALQRILWPMIVLLATNVFRYPMTARRPTA